MTTRFTPGPWRVYSEYGSIGSITNADGSVVVAQAQQVEPRSQETRLANTHLIAAAPALFKALDDLFTDMLIAQGNMRDAAKHDHRWEGCAEEIQPRIDAARAALANAKGETQ